MAGYDWENSFQKIQPVTGGGDARAYNTQSSQPTPYAQGIQSGFESQAPKARDMPGANMAQYSPPPAQSSQYASSAPSAPAMGQASLAALQALYQELMRQAQMAQMRGPRGPVQPRSY